MRKQADLKGIIKSSNWLIIKLAFICILHSTFCISSFAQRYELNKKDTSEVQWMWGKKFYQIKVEKGETIYSITKRFNVTEEELIHYNSDLKQGLKVKMKLLIPVTSSALKPTSTLTEKEEKKPAKKLYNVALILPINIWKNFLPDSVMEDSTDRNQIENETKSNLQFYEGITHAFDSFSSKDCKFHLSVFDTENSFSRFNDFLKNPELKEMDYIIAAGNHDILNQVSQFSEKHKITLLSFSLNASLSFKNNPNAYAFTPSSSTQCIEAGKFCASKLNNANVLVINSSSSKENERGVAFMSGWNNSSESKAKAVNYADEDFNKLVRSFVKGKNNVLFIPSSNEDYVNSLVTKLNDTASTFQFTVIGIPTWQYFESIDPKVMENLNTHLFSSSRINYNDSKTEAFRKYFRNEYLTEPDEIALQGFDAMTFIANQCMEKSKSNREDVYKGLFATYNFNLVNGTNENQKTYILKYHNYELEEVK